MSRRATLPTTRQTRPLQYVPRPAFIPFHQRAHRWATLVTHRRAGKTVALVNDIILAAQTPLFPSPHNPAITNYDEPAYAYIGPTYKQAKRTAWSYLKRYSRHLWVAPPSESELRVTIGNPTNGPSTIWCLGADNADSLRGMYLDGVVCDEYALFKPTVFSQILRPALSDRNGWGVFSSTPRGKNIFWDQYVRALRDPQRHFLLQLRADQSGIIPASELVDLRADMDEEEFAQEYLCSFDSALKGAIYAKEINEVILSGRLHSGPDSLYDPALPTHFVYDLGFTDATVRIAYQVYQSSVRIVNVLAKRGATIFEHMDDILSFQGPRGNIYLPHDARAKNLQTGLSIVEQFIDADLHPKIVPHHNVKDGIAAVRRLFPRLIFDATPFDPTDPYGDNPTADLVEACKQYHREWDDEKLCFAEQPEHDWSSDYCDALRYVAMSLPLDMLEAPPARPSNARMLAALGYNLETLYQDQENHFPRAMT